MQITREYRSLIIKFSNGKEVSMVIPNIFTDTEIKNGISITDIKITVAKELSEDTSFGKLNDK